MSLKNKTANYLIFNRNEVMLVIIDIKSQKPLFSSTAKTIFFNDTLAIIDVRSFKYTITKLVSQAEKSLSTLIYDFILIVDGIKTENREVEIVKEFKKPRKITKIDILKFEEKAKEIVFDSDISIFSVRPSKLTFDSPQPHYSIPFDNAFKNITINMSMLGFDKTTFTNLTNMLNECKINIIATTTSCVLCAINDIVSATSEESLHKALISIEKSHSSVLILKENCFVHYSTISQGFNDIALKISDILNLKTSDTITILEKYFKNANQTHDNYFENLEEDQTTDENSESLDNATILKIKDEINNYYNGIIEQLIEKYIKQLEEQNINTKMFLDVILCGSYNCYTSPLNLVKLTNATISITNYAFYFNEERIRPKNKIVSTSFLAKIYSDCIAAKSFKIQRILSKIFS